MENHNDIIQQQVYAQSIPQNIPQNISQSIPLQQIAAPQINNSFFSKLFTNKYILLIIIIIIIGSIIYYYKKMKKTQIVPQSANSDEYMKKTQIVPQSANSNEYMINDLNGNIIKVAGKYVAEYKKPKKELNISSEENNNIKQFDLTQSEMKEITNKLKS